MKRLLAAAVAAFTIVALACGGATERPCGTTTCTGSDVCVHPCCGGAPPPCVPKDADGNCPTGYSASGQCFGGGDCAPPPCTPDPPFCTNDDAANQYCSGTYAQDPLECYEACA